MSKLVAAVVVSALVGCSSHTLRSAQPVPLAPWVAFVESQRYTQTVLIRHKEQVYRMLCVLELGERGLVLVAFTELGQRLFTLEYGPDRLSIDRSPALPTSFNVKLVLADLQLVYWPLNDIQHSLKPGWSLVESAADNTRHLMHGDETVADVHRSVGVTAIRRPQLGYQMTIEAVSN